jgi:hypothetical protein
VPGYGSLGFACAAPGECRAVTAVPASAPAYGRRAKLRSPRERQGRRPGFAPAGGGPPSEQRHDAGCSREDGSAGQIRRRAGHGEPEASSSESPRRKPRGCPRGETQRVFPSAHASGFQTGRLRVTPAVETAYVTSAGRRPKRRHIRASGAQDGRSERPARRYGVTRSRLGRVERKHHRPDARPTRSRRCRGTSRGR